MVCTKGPATGRDMAGTAEKDVTATFIESREVLAAVLSQTCAAAKMYVTKHYATECHQVILAAHETERAR